MESKITRVWMGAMNLLAVGSSLAALPVAQAASVDERQMEALNAASSQSIESSWLRVPNTCKARGVHADPVPVANKDVSAQVSAIYASFGA